MVKSNFEKPIGWDKLPMFKKIELYGGSLGEDHSKYVDKLKAKEIVEQVCGDRIRVAKVIRILESVEDVKQADLNNGHLIKSAHGSGWNININDDVKLENVKKQLAAWSIKYNANRERQYMFIKPRFFIEEKIVDSVIGATGDALVYMIRCVYSVPISIGVKYKKAQNSYDVNWNNMSTPKLPFEVPKPERLAEMLELASLLASEFEFVRVDFFVGNDNSLYFSEYTFTPAGGCQVYDMETELQQGLLWRANKVD